MNTTLVILINVFAILPLIVLFYFAIISLKRGWYESALTLQYSEYVRDEIENNRHVDDYDTWLERKHRIG